MTNNKYRRAIIDLSHTSAKYELVIIDGRNRNECLIQSIPFLSTKGVILLDDSHRKRYEKAFAHCQSQEFKELTISGLKPNGLEVFSTTIFYRTENVLNI